MAVNAVTEEVDSEVEEAGVLADTVVVVTGSGVAVVAVVAMAAMATTEGDTNATSAKLLITEVDCGLIGLAVTPLGWQFFLLAVSKRDINVWLVEIMIQAEM